MASKGPRCKLDHETRAKRQKVGLLDILFVDYLVLFWGHKSIAVFVTFFFFPYLVPWFCLLYWL